MQKYKIVASKSQKKYTLIISADSEPEAKEKIHKDGYSILSIVEVEDKEIAGNKFLFQVEKNGELKNGVIFGKDIFKVFIKLKDELEYNVIYLYPEEDEAHDSAEKKQLIMDQLVMGYSLQKKEIKQKGKTGEVEESFYLQKKLNETYILINKAIEKFDAVFNDRESYNIDDDTFYKLEKVYEKLIHIKTSTNLFKLNEIGELALIKIAKIELQNIEKNKSSESRALLKETNLLLRKIGSTQHFIEEDKDIKKKIQNFFLDIKKKIFSYKNIKEKKVTRQLIDKDSYGFLKTILLLEKYKDKLALNSKEVHRNIVLFFNPFSSSPVKEKILIKRKVIKQNISILKAKKNGGIASYTGIKKGYIKITEAIFNTLDYLSRTIIIFIYFYIFMFFCILCFTKIGTINFSINTYPIIYFLLGFIVLLLLHVSKNVVLLTLNIVFFVFIFIFSLVNF